MSDKYKGLFQFAVTNEQREAIKWSDELGSAKKAAKKLGVAHGTIHNRLQRVRDRAAKRGWAPDNDMSHTAPNGYSVKGTSTLYDGDGNITAQWVKTNRENDDAQEAMRIFAEEMCEQNRGKFKAASKAPRRAQKADNLTTAFVVGDAHLGLYAWGEETGDESYDLTKSQDDILSAISNLIDRSVDCGNAILCNVGDWFHANGKVPATPMSGNMLDVDSRFGKVARAGTQLQREAMNMMLAKFPTVTLINAKGNHDPDAAMWLNMLAEAVFEKEKRVNVLTNTKKFLHHRWGDTSLFVYHGERNRQQQFEYVTKHYREEFGSSKYAYVINGHIHHVQKEEKGGIMFETFGTLAAKDAYHADNLYDAARTMTSITYDKSYGEVGRQVFDIRMRP